MITMDVNQIENSGQYLLTIDQFKIIDHKATNDYLLPIELMMENAGLHLNLKEQLHLVPVRKS